jgi:hypothetical protein
VRGIVDSPGRRLLVAAVYVVFGAAITIGQLRRGATPTDFPMLAFKWVLVVAFVTLSGFLPATVGAGLAFAAGVWAGALAWLAVLTVAVATLLRAERSDGALRGLALFTGIGLVAGGLWTARFAIALS